jgi:hypothetical protein
LILSVSDRVFDPVGRPKGLQPRIFAELDTESLRRFAPPDRVEDPVPHMRRLVRAAGDRRHQQHFIPILKRVRVPAQEADIFLVHVHIEEAANLA